MIQKREDEMRSMEKRGHEWMERADWPWLVHFLCVNLKSFPALLYLQQQKVSIFFSFFFLAFLMMKSFPTVLSSTIKIFLKRNLYESVSLFLYVPMFYIVISAYMYLLYHLKFF